MYKIHGVSLVIMKVTTLKNIWNNFLKKELEI